MTITSKEWERYRKKLGSICRKAADLMQEYVLQHGFEVDEELIAYAYSLATKYGEAAAELACTMFDDMRAYRALETHAERAMFEPAIPAVTATYDETAAAMQAVGEVSPDTIPNTVSRLVKQAGADTTLQNAARAGAEFAWVPTGNETCAFCITLASRGWQRISKKSLRDGHAEHIHANCDCEYAIRFDSETEIEGYDPEKYLDMYCNAPGKKPKDKINAMRRELYAKNKDEINAQKREAYARRQERENGDAGGEA